MTNPQSIEVIDSFDLTSFGIIAELRHFFNGLPEGTLLKSETNNKEWKIKKRILFYHTMEKQKKFKGESITHSHFNFKTIEDRLVSANNILDREANNTFKYQLIAIEHNSKPQKGEILIKVIPEKFACPCCGYKTFYSEPDGSFDICPVCFWEDDIVQQNDPDFDIGANHISLRQAQRNFLEFGACRKEMLPNVRMPNEDEEKDVSWKPLERK